MFIHFISTMALLIASPILLWIGNEKDNDIVWWTSIVMLIVGEALAATFLAFHQELLISRYESASVSPSVETAARIAEALGVELGELAG